MELAVFLVELADALPVRGDRFADAGLALLGFVLRQLAVNCCLADIHRPAHVRYAEPLFLDHTDDLQLEAEVGTTALPCQVNSSKCESSTYRGVRHY